MASAQGHAADKLTFLEATSDYTPNDSRLGLAFKKGSIFVLLNWHKHLPNRKKVYFVYNRSGQYGYVPRKDVRKKDFDYITKDKFVRAVVEHTQADRSLHVEKDWCIAINYYSPPPSTEDQELAFEIGDKIKITQRNERGWFFGTCGSKKGWFPKTFVQESFVAEVDVEYTYQFTVDALRSFTSSDPTRLQFSIKDQLDVIQRPRSDDEFWMARNKEGRFGLIPKERVEERTDLPSVLFHWQWYHSPCTREIAEKRLRPHKERENYFLVRDSESFPGCFTICITTGVNGRLLNIAVQTMTRGYRLNDMDFATLEDLIIYHSSHAIYDSSPENLDGYQIYLRHPVSRPAL